MTITPDMVEDLRGSEVYDRHDEKIGKVGEVYVDNETGAPKWVTVNTGMFGNKESFVPLDGAKTGRQGVHVATEKKVVKDAPRAGGDTGELSQTQERELYSHYGLQTPGDNAYSRGGNGHGAGQTDARGQQHTDSERGTDRHEGGMTRSEERLVAGTESAEAGQVRLRKYVVTEQQTVQVPVSHEEVRLEREPVGGDTRRDVRIGEDEQSMTLHAERPVVGKETHAVENVRLDKKTVTENQTFSDEVRKEHIDVEDPSNLMGTESKGQKGRDAKK